MNCIVTAGPTYEALDRVRRLTNFSTGKLGTELAQSLTGQGHSVILLRGYYSVHRQDDRAGQVLTFTTTTDLSQKLQSLASPAVHAVFHAAAVSDFAFGKVFLRSGQGTLTEVSAGKLSTRLGPLLVELVPTPKIIGELRAWFPRSLLVGWKFEVDGSRSNAVSAGREQIERCQTDACVVNGPAYGEGFGLISGTSECQHASDRRGLFDLLSRMMKADEAR